MIDPFKLDEFTLGRAPNLRRCIIPPLGYTCIDMDLSRADVQVVAWEAEEEVMKKALKANVDLHLFNAANVYQLPLTMDDMTEGSSSYDEACIKYYPERHKCKTGGHALNYGVMARKLSLALGISLKEAEEFGKKWFGTYPGISKWHKRIQTELNLTRTVTNKFGYRMPFLGRVETLFNEALAWVPQSTVALTINHAMNNIMENIPEVIMALQVHDSLTMFSPTTTLLTTLPKIKENSKIIIPYDDPLIIPVGFKFSDKSWGDVKDVKGL